MTAPPALSYSFGSTRVAILDTDYILNQLKDRVRFGIGCRTSAGPPVGQARSFASSHVLQELYKADALGNRDKWDKLAKQSQSEGWPRRPDTFREIFESEYLEDITFVNVSGMFEDDPIAQKVRLRGASDTPTAQLAVLLARARPIVHSHDHSLWEPGLAPAPERFQ